MVKAKLYAFFSIYIILYFENKFPNILINFNMNYEPFSKYIQNDLYSVDFGPYG